MWEIEFCLSNGHDEFTIRNADHRGWGISGEVVDWGSTMAVVMACARVSNDREVAVVMQW